MYISIFEDLNSAISTKACISTIETADGQFQTIGLYPLDKRNGSKYQFIDKNGFSQTFDISKHDITILNVGFPIKIFDKIGSNMNGTLCKYFSAINFNKISFS